MKSLKTTLALVPFALCALPAPMLAGNSEPTAAPVDATEAAPIKTEPADPADPDWFNKLLKRELELGPVTEVKSADGYFRARVPAKVSAEPTVVDDSHYVVFDAGMGADGPVECWVFHDDRDLATSIKALSDSTFELFGERLGKVELKAIQGVDAGVVGAHPFLGLNWIYRVATDKGALAGQIKHLIASRHGRAVYCLNSAVGFNQAFRGVFEALVTSIEYAAPSPVPYFSETHVVSIKGQRVGVSHHTHSLDEDGDVKIVERSSMMMPVDQQTLQTQDSIRVEFSRRDGTVISLVTVEVEGGEMATNLQVEPLESGWLVSGTFSGKPLEATLENKALRSDLGQRRDIAKLVAAAKVGESITLTSWSEDLDPMKLDEMVVTYLGPEERGHKIKLATGPLQVTGVADASGFPVAIDMPLGPVSLLMERVRVDGSLEPPKPAGD